MQVLVSIYYLELNCRTAFSPPAISLTEHGGTVRLVDPANWNFPRSMYRAVGAPFQWTDRLVWSDAEWQEYAARSTIRLYELQVLGETAGYFELELGENHSVQIAYFGLLPGFVGRSLGGGLLAEAVQQAWAIGAQRVWVHTCTLDHQHALINYQRRGFSLYLTRTVIKELDSLPTDSLAARERDATMRSINPDLESLPPPHGDVAIG